MVRADLDVLFARVSAAPIGVIAAARSSAVLAELIERRHPIYAEADLVIDSAKDSRCGSGARGDRAIDLRALAIAA